MAETEINDITMQIKDKTTTVINALLKRSVVF